MLWVLGNLILGLLLFLGGMALMRYALKAAAGPQMRSILQSVTGSLPVGIVVGAGLTAFIQSSSATLAILISLVNAGIIPVSNIFGVIFGANIGTTFTIQLISIRLGDYAGPVIYFGLILVLIGHIRKRHRYTYPGLTLTGFGLLFVGMDRMGYSLIMLETYEHFLMVMMEVGEHSLFGLFLGLILTALSQSSSAITGIVITLLKDEMLTFRAALPVIFGCNIGTCMTALLAAIGSNIYGKRTAIVHLLFNTLGALIFFALLGPFAEMAARTASSPARRLANAHTLFNLLNTLIMVPFIPLLDRLSRLIIPKT